MPPPEPAPSRDSAERAIASIARSLAERGVSVAFVPAIGHTHLAAYHPKSQGGPSIEIFRHAGAPSDPWRDLSLLAHEAGHQYSDQIGRRGAAYEAAAASFSARLPLDDDQTLAILVEECLAWQIGRVLLKIIDAWFPAYEADMRNNLELYRRSLNVSEGDLATVEQCVGQQFTD